MPGIPGIGGIGFSAGFLAGLLSTDFFAGDVVGAGLCFVAADDFVIDA